MTSAACCSGHTHPGEPRGITGTLHGLPSYITEPPENGEVKAIVVMIPDAFGWEFVNLRLLADTLAERLGVRCLLPEFMNGMLFVYIPARFSLKDIGSHLSSSLVCDQS